MEEARKPSENTENSGPTSDQSLNFNNNDKSQPSSMPSSSSSPSPSPSPSSSSSSSSSSSGFDCNICLELAQEPVVTLCGHLFCWPCLYRWLHSHSTCQDCPVCKALVEEDKLVPLYGRGGSNSKINTSDPRRKSAGFGTTGSYSDIPQRPQGHRPQTAARPHPADHHHHHHHNANAFHYPNNNMGGVPNVAAAAARFGNFTFSAGFGIFPSLFGFHMQGFPDLAGGGLVGGTGYPFGFPMGFHGAARAYPPPTAAMNMAPGHDQQETKLSRLLMFLGFLVVFYILFF